jgi:DNA-binding transcriptional MocR family regulator
MRYRSIAERLSDEILRDKRPGERLPGVRELAKKENISLVTARNVYQYLADKGLVISRQGAGTFVSFNAPEDGIDMAAIRPPDELLLRLSPHLKITLEGIQSYDPPQGFGPLREQANAWLRSLGIDQTPIVTAGSQQALFLVGLALLKKGDVVAVENPGYMGASRIFESLGAIVRPVSYILNPQDLEKIAGMDIRALYTMPQGQIPTGGSIPEDLRGKLLDLARKRDFFIIEDDPLSEVVNIMPLKARDDKDRVIYIKSLSNILGPGLRIGFTVAPEPILTRIVHYKEINDLCLSGIIQRCLFSMISSYDLKEHIKRLREELKTRISLIPKNTGWTTRGPCLWIKTAIPSRISRERLLEMGVRITPGDIYGPQWSDHIRVSLLAASRTDFESGLMIIRNYLEDKQGPSLTEF